MTSANCMRLADWHAFQALQLLAAGKADDAAESLQSAVEWLANAGLPTAGISDPTEVHGLTARARTGVLE